MKRILLAVLLALLPLTAHAADFAVGGDITQANYIEDLGGEFFDKEGAKCDPLVLMSDNGVNTVRIRLSNNPGKGRGDGTFYMREGYQDEADCLNLAKRAAALGLDIEWTFNYSDYWSNGERQIIPHDWQDKIKEELGYDVDDYEFLNSMTDEQIQPIRKMLGDLVYDYTKDILTKLKEQNSEPKYVSLGNEIRGGIFFPFANTYDAHYDPKSRVLAFDGREGTVSAKRSWESLTEILNRGYDAVKEVCPSAKVIIHIDNGSNLGSCQWFFDEYIKAGGKLDILGVSYYPAWSGNTAQACFDFCRQMKEIYKKDIMIMETGFNWNPTRKDGYPGQLVDIDAYKDKYPPTPENQAAFLAELMQGLKDTDACVGFLYWDPIMIHVNGDLSGWAYRESDDGVEPNVVENTTWFDFDGKALPVLDAVNEFAPKKSYISPQYSDGKLVSVHINNKYTKDARYLFDGTDLKFILDKQN